MTTTMSPTISALAAAAAKMQGEIRHATKDAVNPHFQRTYADLASVIDAARGPLAANGLAIIQMPGAVTADGVHLTTTMMHSSGEFISETLTMPLAKKDPQGVGSALTYARRYAYAAAVGIAQVDDDGNGSSRRERDDDEQRDERPIGAQERTDDQRREIEALVKTLGVTEDIGKYLRSIVDFGREPPTIAQAETIITTLKSRVSAKEAADKSRPSSGSAGKSGTAEPDRDGNPSPKRTTAGKTAA